MTDRTASLFQSTTERWTDDARKLAHEVDDALRPIFDKYYAKGYPAREISHVVHSCAFEQELMRVI